MADTLPNLELNRPDGTSVRLSGILFRPTLLIALRHLA
jgi:hypothetical protein